jgi:F-type H+-transporting ATPase subunit epsilon
MALPTKLHLDIVTPERALAREEVDEVVVPGAEGDFGILPGHTPMLATLRVGELWYRKGNEKSYLAVAFGFVEVLPDRVTILARIGEHAREIDVERAERARRLAEEALKVPHAKPLSDDEFERVRISLMKSLIRIQVSHRVKTTV